MTFERLIALLVEAPVLTYPYPSRQYILDTDASNEAAGAVLSQMVKGEECVIAYYIKTFSPPQRNYCVTRRELLAVVMAVNHFRPYLYDQEFRLRTDHASLLWLYKRTELLHQVARWLESLAEYQFKLEHRAGASMEMPMTSAAVPTVHNAPALRIEIGVPTKRSWPLATLR